MEDFDTIINEFWAFDNANKAHSVDMKYVCHHVSPASNQSSPTFFPPSINPTLPPLPPFWGNPPPKGLVSLLPRPFFLKLPGHQNPKARPGESEKSCVASVGSAYGSNLLLAWSKSEKKQKDVKEKEGM